MLAHPEVDVEALLDEARAKFALEAGSPHGMGHWLRVLRFGLVYARELGGDTAVVTVACVGHDACRISEDGGDVFHGHRAADWLAGFNGKLFSFDRQRMKLLREMVSQHNDGGYMPTDATASAFVSADRSDIDRDGVGLNVSSRYFAPDAWRVYVDKIMPMKARVAA